MIHVSVHTRAKKTKTSYQINYQTTGEFNTTEMLNKG